MKNYCPFFTFISLFVFTMNGYAQPLNTAQTILLTQPSNAFQPNKVTIGQGPDAFAIDQTEVTIAAFTDFAKQTNLVTEAEQKGGGYEYRFGWEQRPGWTFRTPYGVKPVSMQEPAVHISWFEAQAYCKHQGGTLPTQAQWSQAAYTEQRSNSPSPFVKGETYAYPTGSSGSGANTVGGSDGWTEHAPVASFPAGVNGLFDMGANAWEWLADAQGNDRLTAGGSWWYGPQKMKREGMQYKAADFYAVYVGFRCVYPVGLDLK